MANTVITIASGYSGSGISGYSGYSGVDGSGGSAGSSGYSGESGYSGYSGSGVSGYSGSGVSGYSGYSGKSGYSGYSGTSGYSGYSGVGGSGYSGYSGMAGAFTASGYSGISGYSGFSGQVGNLISQVVTAGNATTVTFSSIPSTFADLEIRWTCRSNVNAATGNLQLIFNGVNTGNAYQKYQSLTASGGSAGAGADGASANFILCGVCAGATVGATRPGTGVMYFNNYTNTTYHKQAICYSAYATSTDTNAFAFYTDTWASTASITSITISLSGGNSFVNGSTFTLYGAGAAGTSGYSGYSGYSGLLSMGTGAKTASDSGALWETSYGTSGFFYNVDGASGWVFVAATPVV